MSQTPTVFDPILPILFTAVTEAVSTSLTGICGVTPVRLGLTAPAEESISIIAGIPFTGDPGWILSALLPQETAKGLAKAFAGFDIPPDSLEMTDAIGEIVRNLAEHVIARLGAAGMKTQMTLPMVARGDPVRLYPSGAASLLLFGYEIPQGRFWIRIVTVSPHESKAQPTK